MNLKTIITVFILLTFLIRVNAQEVMVAFAPEGLPKPTKEEKTTIVSTYEDTSILKFSFINYTTKSEASTAERNESNDVIDNTFDRFQKLYTYTTTIAPGNPGLKTVVRKPVIYNTVIKLNKHYQKQLKKGKLTENDVRRAFSKTLNIAIAAFYNDTKEFEEVLKSTKEITTLAKIFEKAEVVNL